MQGNENIILSKAQNIIELLETCPKNKTIGDNLVIAYSKINSDKYKKIMCAISGGSDSDVMLDIVWRCDKDNKVDYVWFDTGLEYQATKDHIKYLEEKYNITIRREKAQKAIPTCCKEYGQPFLSKFASEMISRLQRHNFTWEDLPYEYLLEKYPRCKNGVSWWCNKNQSVMFNIGYNRYLKEFMIANPPGFKISNKCCTYAKKNVAHKLLKIEKYDLNILGVRRAEGGIRQSAYKNCFDENDNGCDNYRPLFWYTDSDKVDYENHYGVIHSKCYSEYGLKRTGCCGCSYNRKLEEEIAIIYEHEPKLYKMVTTIFGDSYEYTRKYREFVRQNKEVSSIE